MTDAEPDTPEQIIVGILTSPSMRYDLAALPGQYTPEGAAKRIIRELEAKGWYLGYRPRRKRRTKHPQTPQERNVIYDTPRQIEVWSEGYAATGEHSRAFRFGTAYAHSLREAADIVFTSEPDLRRRAEHTRYYNRERLTYWACRLFDNEQDARRSFG